ncbi:MAG: hypothetical protein JJ957_15500 [Pseudomonadales bacterium]|nr:hypothetical protein [Pseudomonadales bacterium]MBO6597191.1 hypothetical protein [Pseudomonadales bacterium]MBO6823623.1 hypothetical protein [Pseudomonadales bacterium]
MTLVANQATCRLYDRQIDGILRVNFLFEAVDRLSLIQIYIVLFLILQFFQYSQLL